MNLLRSQAGSIVENVIAAIIIISSITGAMILVKNFQNSKRSSVEMESATDLAIKKLEILINAPWSSADLVAGTHTDAEDELEWIVTDDPSKPRLKKVEVIAKFRHPVSGASSDRASRVVGYRYNDF